MRGDVVGVPTGRHYGDPRYIMQTALKELAEEGGGSDEYDCSYVSSFHTSPGNIKEEAHVYMATSIQIREQDLQPTEQIGVGHENGSLPRTECA